MTNEEENTIDGAYLEALRKMFHNFHEQLFLLARNDIPDDHDGPSPDENLRFGLTTAEEARVRMKEVLKERRRSPAG